MDGFVYRLAFDSSDNLYASGQFTTAGGVSTGSTAKWDGSSWSSLNSNFDIAPEALACDSSGNLYAGGSFTNIDGYIAKWDGSSWTPLGSGPGGTVSSLVFDGGGNLYAGRSAQVAKWDGSSWTDLGTGLNDTVRALAIPPSNSKLYAGGHFNTTSGKVAGYIAQWASSTGKLALTDFNGDGKTDLLWRNDSKGGNVIWLMDGATMSSSGTTNVTFTNTDSVWTGNFDNDAKSDILVYRVNQNKATIHIMNGTHASESEDIALGIDPALQVVAIGHFNRGSDDNSDILWRNPSTGANEVWLMDKFTFSQQPLNAIGSDWQLIGTGDFNGDGHSDLLWRKNTGHNVIWLMNGTTILPESGNIYTVTDFSWKIVAIYDFDGDGMSDLFWRNEGNGFNVIWLMNGASIKSDGNTSWVPLDWKMLALGSYGNDGNILWRKQVDNSAFSIVWKQLTTDKPESSASPPQELRLEWHIMENTPKPARKIEVSKSESYSGTLIITDPPTGEQMPKQKPDNTNPMNLQPPLPVMNILKSR